ncbi:uncharacterized protein [Spinacia oleracea]|uniref:Uncharacterized protein n=1 Tax=Spinacia oleracea TaxID=3562 RepID=A0ABM3QYY9_SPIOL|nr:uncharacterized protein LOC130463479 [Spinacia oleracea]
MKLNPKKCVLGVRAGKFLGFMVSERAIDANPDKVQAALDLPKPKTKRDVQRLTGGEVEPVKKKGVPRKVDPELTWEQEKKDAFQQLRAHLAQLPTLAMPKEGETLYLYVAVSPGTEMLDDTKRTWEVYTDGSSTVNGSGAGVVLIPPAGKSIEYALKFGFKATNNEVEYEAAIAGIELCLSLEAEHVCLKTDSQLVANQIRGEYEAKWPTVNQKKWLIVGVDYFSKWIEAEAVSSITEPQVRKFIWQNIITRFGIPRLMVFDYGKQFDNTPLQKWCKQFGIHLAYSAVCHPQSNGQAEAANKLILNALK